MSNYVTFDDSDMHTLEKRLRTICQCATEIAKGGTVPLLHTRAPSRLGFKLTIL